MIIESRHRKLLQKVGIENDYRKKVIENYYRKNVIENDYRKKVIENDYRKQAQKMIIESRHRK